MAAAVLGLSASVVITTAPPAAAFVPAPVLPAALSVMEVGTASGGLAAAAGGLCATGAGCAVVVGGLAIAAGAFLAYTFSDEIFSWVETETGFGTSDGYSWPYDGGPGTPVSPLASGSINTSNWTVMVTSQPNNSKVIFELQCRLPSGSVTSDLIFVPTEYPANTYWFTGAQSWLQNCERSTSLGGWGGVVQWFGTRVYRDGEYNLLAVSYWNPVAEPSTTVDVQCRLPDGSVVSRPQVSTPGVPTSGSIAIPNCSDEYPGSRTEDVAVNQVLPDGTVRPVAHWAVNNTALAAYPDCAPSDAECALQVLKQPSGSVCTSSLSGCGQWWEYMEANPSSDKFRCKWGPYSVPLSWCKPLRYAYQAAPVTDASGWPTAADPAYSPSADPVTDTDPGTGGGTTPIPALDDPFTLPEEGTTDSPGACSLGWGDLLNGAVVYKAVSCALSWAFVPRTDFMTETATELETSWSSSSVGTFVTAGRTMVEGLSDSLTTTTDCQGPGMPIPLAFMDETETFYPLEACDGIRKDMADRVHLIATVVLVFMGGVLLVNTVLRAFGLPKLFGGSEAVSDGN